MNTKEAINMLIFSMFAYDGKKTTTITRPKLQKIYNEGMNEIINLLKRGEAYEKIIEELEKEWGHHLLSTNYCRWTCVKNIINRIKQKYFPKE